MSITDISEMESVFFGLHFEMVPAYGKILMPNNHYYEHIY